MTDRTATHDQLAAGSTGLIEEPVGLFTVVTVSYEATPAGEYPRSISRDGETWHWVKAPTTTGDQEHVYWYPVGGEDGYDWEGVVRGAEQVAVAALPVAELGHELPNAR